MARFIRFTLFSFLLCLVFLIPYGFAANRVVYENFDNKSTGVLIPEKGAAPYELSPPQYNLDQVGRGGSGYCYSSGTLNEAFLMYYPSKWPTDEFYVSCWLRFPRYREQYSMENIKMFYPHWDGANSYVHYSLADANTIYYSARDKNQIMLSESNWLSCPGMTDGNWHRYEFYVNFATGGSKFWYDGAIKVNNNFGSGKWTNAIYYITIGSVDAQDASDFSRQFDDVEFWDGMPDTTAAPKPPTGLKIVN